MLIIDTDLEVNTIVVSKLDTGDLEASLSIHSDYNNSDYLIKIGSDQSLNKRYSKFIVSDYSTLQSGLHQYSILVHDEVKETGMLKVTSTDKPVESYLPVSPIDDDLKVFRI